MRESVPLKWGVWRICTMKMGDATSGSASAASRPAFWGEFGVLWGLTLKTGGSPQALVNAAPKPVFWGDRGGLRSLWGFTLA